MPRPNTGMKRIVKKIGFCIFNTTKLRRLKVETTRPFLWYYCESCSGFHRHSFVGVEIYRCCVVPVVRSVTRGTWVQCNNMHGPKRSRARSGVSSIVQKGGGKGKIKDGKTNHGIFFINSSSSKQKVYCFYLAPIFGQKRLLLSL